MVLKLSGTKLYCYYYSKNKLPRWWQPAGRSVFLVQSGDIVPGILLFGDPKATYEPVP